MVLLKCLIAPLLKSKLNFSIIKGLKTQNLAFIAKSETHFLKFKLFENSFVEGVNLLFFTEFYSQHRGIKSEKTVM